MEYMSDFGQCSTVNTTKCLPAWSTGIITAFWVLASQNRQTRFWTLPALQLPFLFLCEKRNYFRVILDQHCSNMEGTGNPIDEWTRDLSLEREQPIWGCVCVHMYTCGQLPRKCICSYSIPPHSGGTWRGRTIADILSNIGLHTLRSFALLWILKSHRCSARGHYAGRRLSPGVELPLSVVRMLKPMNVSE